MDRLTQYRTVLIILVDLTTLAGLDLNLKEL